MTNHVDPEIALDSLKKITVELRFLYEHDIDGYTLSHTTSDQFGEHIRSIRLPFDFHHLEPEVVKVKFGTRVNNTTLSVLQLEHLLNSIQHQIVNKCYNQSSVALLIAYLKRIELLTDTILKSQNITIITSNADLLEQAGYHPNFITSKENDYKKDLSEEISATLTEPMQMWLKSLIVSITYSTSLKASRGILKEFTKIGPPNTIKRSSRISSSFRILKTPNRRHLPQLYRALIDSGSIRRETKEEDFIHIFSEMPIINKITWTGKYGQLLWFVRALGERMVIADTGAILETAALIFKIEDKDVLKILKGGKETTSTPPLIEEALNKFSHFG